MIPRIKDTARRHDRCSPWAAWAAGVMLLAALTGGQAVAAAFQSHESIRAAVRAFLAQQAKGQYEHTRIVVDRLDPRLSVKKCSKPLAPFFPSGSELLNLTTVGVQCRGATPWTLYVPADVKVMEDVVVTKRPLARGHRVTARDITVAERDLSTLRMGYIGSPQRVIGMVIRRPVPIGSVINSSLLEKSRLIRRGEDVLIIARTAGVEVRMMGRALDDGGQGDLVKVRNLSSRQIVVGTVTAAGTVNVHL